MRKYEKISDLGVGTFGKVILAKDKTTNRQVAIKIYEKSRIIDIID